MVPQILCSPYTWISLGFILPILAIMDANFAIKEIQGYYWFNPRQAKSEIGSQKLLIGLMHFWLVLFASILAVVYIHGPIG
ncbi:MAG: hypothetical protein NTY66_04690 [Candidatus Vogelbacteria bacterium]|nr:hypothetical protein [Candidatus Vogelbacteria bacterium]